LLESLNLLRHYYQNKRIPVKTIFCSRREVTASFVYYSLIDGTGSANTFLLLLYSFLFYIHCEKSNKQTLKNQQEAHDG